MNTFPSPSSSVVVDSATPPELPLFGRIGTTVLTISMVVIFFIIQIITLVISAAAIIVTSPENNIYDRLLSLIQFDGTVLSISIALNGLIIFGLTCLLIKLRNNSIKSYLAFNPFNYKIALFGFALWLAYIFASEGLLQLLEKQPMDFLTVYVESAEPWWLLFVGIVFFAPIYEEILFRGLLWKAIAEQFNDKQAIPLGKSNSNYQPAISKKGAIIASVVTGLLFSAIHLQYDLVEVSTIFILALIMGFVRYRSGSLWLPILIHIANNGLAMVQYTWLTTS